MQHFKVDTKRYNVAWVAIQPPNDNGGFMFFARRPSDFVTLLFRNGLVEGSNLNVGISLCGLSQLPNDPFCDTISFGIRAIKVGNQNNDMFGREALDIEPVCHTRHAQYWAQNQASNG